MKGREMTADTVRLVGPTDGKLGRLGGIGIRFMVDGADSGGGFALVEHPLEPRALAAPMHRHTREDEFSFVLEGRIGAILGDQVVHAEPGDLLFKPRGQWHTFWNATDEPARLLEVISPAGFERFFERMTDMAASGELSPPTMKSLAAEYGAEVDPDSVPGSSRSTASRSRTEPSAATRLVDARRERYALLVRSYVASPRAVDRRRIRQSPVTRWPRARGRCAPGPDRRRG